jgi:transitional endoplasmic reticulum ATPase
MNLNPVTDPKKDIGGFLAVTFEAKRKYEPVINEIVALTKKKLKEESIYKGKAINSRFEFFDLTNFNPDKVIYSLEDERRIGANILQPIRHTDTWRKAGSSLKRGVLLYGAYGTGKTLTALLTAHECQKHGWTFINVLPGDDIAPSLKIAKRFAPAVVFFEDIDQATHGERDADLNQILNTVDGVVGKGDEVMVILTTNHVDKINPAMMRPGRLDAAIPCGELDAYATEKLIRSTAMDMYGESKLEGELDMTAVMDAATGYTSAFITESVVKAKAYALARLTTNTNWNITSDDIVSALKELRPQYVMMRGNVVEAEPSMDARMTALVEEALGRKMTDPTFLNAMSEAIEQAEE